MKIIIIIISLKIWKGVKKKKLYYIMKYKTSLNYHNKIKFEQMFVFQNVLIAFALKIQYITMQNCLYFW